MTNCYYNMTQQTCIGRSKLRLPKKEENPYYSWCDYTTLKIKNLKSKLMHPRNC